MHRACDTIVWGRRQKRQLDSVLRVTAEAGFEGLEIGADVLAAADLSWLRDELGARGLKLAAIRMVGKLDEVLAGPAEGAVLDRVLGAMAALDVPLLICTGVACSRAADLQRHIAALNRSATRCREHARRLLYMNGTAEFGHDAMAMTALRQDTSPDLGLCAAVGSLHKAGVAVVGFLMEHRGRLGAVHLQDFATRTLGLADAVELGLGVVPLTKVTAWMRRSRLDDLWVVAEQGRGKGFPAQAVRRNGAFMIQELSRRGRERG